MADNLQLSELKEVIWEAGGIYAANPTVQRIISVPGRPLPPHGQELGSDLGGHVIQLSVSNAEISVWPLKDLKLEILNLEKNLEARPQFVAGSELTC